VHQPNGRSPKCYAGFVSINAAPCARRRTVAVDETMVGPRTNSPPRHLRLVAAFLGLIALGTSVYWLQFFTSGDVQVRTDEIYLAFERAFPLADAWLTGCALGGAIGLWRRRPWGLLFGLLAGSSLVFLGAVDMLFSLNEGNYRIASMAMAAEVAIEVVTLVGGPIVIAYLWMHRHALLDR